MPTGKSTRSRHEVVRDDLRPLHRSDGASIGELARWLSEQRRAAPGPARRCGIARPCGRCCATRPTAGRPRSARRKTGRAARQADTHHPRARRAPRPPRSHATISRAEQWTLHPRRRRSSPRRPSSSRRRALGRERTALAKRNTKEPTLLQGILVCRECGYCLLPHLDAHHATSGSPTTAASAQDNYRHVGGRVCTSRPDPRRRARRARVGRSPPAARKPRSRSAPRSTAVSTALRTEHPATRRREALERDLTRAKGAIARLIEAYQEQLISLDELRARTPTLRKRQTTLPAQLDALDAELHNAETYLKLADTLEGFLARLTDDAQTNSTIDGTATHPAARRPRSPHRRRRRHDHHPALDPHPHRPRRPKLPFAWEQSSHRYSQTSLCTCSMRRGREAGSGSGCW